MNDDVYTSPAIYDVDQDGRMEIAISSRDGKISLLRYDGSYMPGWPISTGLSSVSSPTLCDIDGDDKADLFICANNTVYMWGYDGKPKPGWPVVLDANIVASPSVGDINGDGKKEVVIGVWNGKIYALNRDGSTVNGWPVTTDGSISSSSALGDIDGDSRLEVVIGSNNGNVYAIEGDGKIVNGWPVSTGSNILQSSPAIGDIDGDGRLEIVVVSSNGLVYVWHGDDKLKAGWPLDLHDTVSSSPVLGDIDGDGRSMEIVICTDNGLIYMLKNDGTIIPGWPAEVAGTISTPPALADIDGDGNVDIAIGTSTEDLYVGLVYAFSSTGKKIDKTWPISINGNIINSSPAIDDLNGDGNVELVIGSCSLSDGTGGKVHVWNLPGIVAKDKILWGQFLHDSCHTSLIPSKAPSISVEESQTPPLFTITVLQNTGDYIDISVVAMKPLIATPELTVVFDGSTSSIPFNQVDNSPYKYQTRYEVKSSGSYTFTVSGTDKNGNVGSSSKTILIQKINNGLLQNYPNPFNPETWIPYQLKDDSDVTIRIYDISGSMVRELNLGHKTSGIYTSKESSAYWDGRNESGESVASGVYFYAIKTKSYKAIKKMVVTE